MKLIIQIPCYNEEETLPITLAEIPREIPGVDLLGILVIDDGSTDRTVEVAREAGVEYIVQHRGNKGLARAFQTGLDTSLALGAELIVNTDGDNQYPGSEIPRLIEPILARKADIVIADRQVDSIPHFSRIKKLLQKLGSLVVRIASSTGVPDAPSGFRAYTREAALRLNVLTRYTYTLDTIIQAGKKNLTITDVPIRTHPQYRDSRLVTGKWSYVRKSAAAILRLYLLYEPLRTFFYVALPFLMVGFILISRFLYFFVTDQVGVGRYIQSVAIGGTSLILGFIMLLLGVLAHVTAVNRQISEEILYYAKKNSTLTDIGDNGVWKSRQDYDQKRP